MKEKILSLILTSIILLSLIAFLPITASAYSSGTCGENLTWILDDEGTLTITGTGKMTDYSFSSHTPWFNNSAVKNIVVENGVTSIGEYAFFGTSSITGVVLPNSVKNIGKHAFSNLPLLTNIKIPESVTYIGEAAFYNCSRLTKAELPKNLEIIGSHVFGGCFSLETVILQGSVKNINNQTFDGCTELAKIYIPKSVTTIGNAAFRDCNKLTVYYEGDEENWQAIAISSYFNECLTGAPIYYNSSARQDIILSENKISADPYTCQQLSVYKSDGVTPYDKSFKVISSAPNVVTTSRSGNKIILSFNSLGSAEITVSATDGSGAKAICNVTVSKQIQLEDTYLLERLALCQIVYSDDTRKTDGGHDAYDLIVGKKIGDLTQKANKKGEMFYTSKNEIIKHDIFYKQYINDYIVIKLPDNPQMGFYAAAFESPHGDIVIAYRGSEGDHQWRGIFMRWDETEVDWWDADFKMFLGQLSSQFPQALEFYDDVKKENPGKRITLTGHSLGGALSSYVATNRNVRCDNVNGATGFIYNRDVLEDTSDYMVEFEGFDKYVFENFSEHDDLANNVVTRFKNLGSFNYNEYVDSKTSNEKNDGKLTFDYHAVSSILDYNNGRISLTRKSNEFIAEPYIKYGNRYIGTSADNTYVAPSSMRIKPGSVPGRNKRLNLASQSHYILAGDGNDEIILPEGGNDTLIGNAGNDTLNGGPGNDIYVYGGNFGNDTIIDPSGDDKIVFTDVSLSDIIVSGNIITCGLNTIEISNKTKRTDSFTLVDKNNRTTAIESATINLFSSTATDYDATKGIQVLGNATVEIYDEFENLIEILTVNEYSETEVRYTDYGMLTFSPKTIGMTLPSEGYIVKVKSDEAVSVWTVSNADNPTVAKQTFVLDTDLSEGMMIVINTGEMVDEQLSVKLTDGSSEKDLYSEELETLTISADRTEIKTGEAVTMSVPETFASSVLWQCSNNNVVITKNEDLSVNVTGIAPGEETVRAYLPNDELYFAEFSFTITEDSEPGVVVTCEGETYDGTVTATDSVLFDVTMVNGYDTIVFDTFSPYSQIEDTNEFVVNSVGEHTVNIYCKNSQTGAKTKSFTFEYSQDSEAPTIYGAENETVYYTDRVIEVSDNALDSIYINGELCEKETFIISEAGNYTVTAEDTAGNKTDILFEIKTMPAASLLSIEDTESVSQIRNDFEEVKYSLSEERMNTLETEISLLEEIINSFYATVEITLFTAERQESDALINLTVENVHANDIVYIASYNSNGKLLEVQPITLNKGVGEATFSAAEVYSYKAFVWDDKAKPLAESKEYKLN